MAADRQDPIVAFLSDPAAHGGARVDVVWTHMSVVFLADDRVYKLKRAVRYPFADFSTAALRRRACDNELAVNRRAAPALYRRVRALCVVDGVAMWAEDAPESAPCDYVVEMARFEADDQFDLMIAQGRLTPDHVRALADVVAATHASGPAGEGRSSAALIDDLVQALEGGALGAAQPEATAAWCAQIRRCETLTAAARAARQAGGFVRRCHGDLHLANICLFEGRPTPFDAIEFDDAIATVDVLFDLAFTVADLVRYGREDFANGLVNRYLAITEDYGGASLLAFYASLRAATRAMVLSLPTAPTGERARAGAYLDDAVGFLEPPATPRLIVCGGYSGSGKSTAARALAASWGDPIGGIVIASDPARKRRAGVMPERPLGESAYTAAVSEAVYETMFAHARTVLAAGRTAILDATFGHAGSQQAAAALARACGVRFHGLWFAAPPEILRARIAARRDDASDATPDLVDRQIAAFVVPESWTVVDAAGAVQSTLAGARAALS
ncbi:MAG: AAA family ATPase [Pseudomonadota bacterium]